MKNNKTLIIIVALIVIAFIVILAKNKKAVEEKVYIPNVNASVIVSVAPVTEKKVSVNLEYLATLSAKSEAALSSPISAIVDAVYFEDGDFVQKGKPLAQLDVDNIREDYQAALSRQNADSLEYYRYLKASQLSPGSVSPNQLNQLESKNRMNKANTQKLLTQLRYARLEAPFSGYINAKNIQRGNLLTSNIIYARLTNTSVLEGTFDVSESDVRFLKKGQRMQVTTEYDKVNAPIIYVANRADDQHKYQVKIELPNENNRFITGQYVTVTSTSSTEKNALVVPRSALLGSLRVPKIYVVKNGVAYLTEVKVYLSTDQEVAISADHVKAGDLVVVSGQISLKDGSKVRFN